ncbi:chemotaxis protein CheW [Sporolactobacillus sp. Y61]|jgi:chemotaxis signal transduction protein|uniref:Chemotaxis protein CheW n=1 Tax=Sporolactobacillus sp. Y61 TaxID=3160863 RepID=A0AAU8IHG2_9BACL|nr:chemotaxis protein CheW [Sporolactobacillus sp. THM19-2]RYL94159.1 chemotaxis protein CheW [Sporolactobacillus sp. THM19-2]
MSSDTTTHVALTLLIGDITVGLLIRDVREILEPIPAIDVPVTHPCFAGLILNRGEVLPLFDLSGLLEAGYSPALKPEDKKYIICQSASGACALEADAVRDTISFSSEQLYACDLPLRSKKVLLKDKELPLLDSGAVMANISRLNQSVRKSAGY